MSYHINKFFCFLVVSDRESKKRKLEPEVNKTQQEDIMFNMQALLQSYEKRLQAMETSTVKPVTIVKPVEEAMTSDKESDDDDDEDNDISVDSGSDDNHNNHVQSKKDILPLEPNMEEDELDLVASDRSFETNVSVLNKDDSDVDQKDMDGPKSTISSDFHEVLQHVFQRFGHVQQKAKPKEGLVGQELEEPRSYLYLPSSSFQQRLFDSQASLMLSKMEANPDSRERIMPKRVKPNMSYVTQQEDVLSARTFVPVLNPSFVEVLSDEKNKAGRPVGFISFSQKESKELEIASRWQLKYLTYAENLCAASRKNLEESVEMFKQLKDSDDKMDNLSSKIDIAFKTQNEIQRLLESAIIPGQVFLHASLETAKRDSFLQAMTWKVQDSTVRALRSAPFHPLAKVFPEELLEKAKEDIGKRDKLYINHRIFKSNVQHNNLPDSNYSNKNKSKQNKNQNKKYQKKKQYQNPKDGVPAPPVNKQPNKQFNKGKKGKKPQNQN